MYGKGYKEAVGSWLSTNEKHYMNEKCQAVVWLHVY